MNLNQRMRHLIYDCKNTEVPDNYIRFGIMSQERSLGEREVKLYPLPEKEHIFAVLWNAHDRDWLSATMLPSEYPFLFERSFQKGTRTQMHSHEYLELFYVVDGEYHQKIQGKEYTFQKGELCLIDQNCLHQEILGEASAMVLFLGISKAMFNDITKRQVTEEKIADFLKLALLEQKTLQQYLHFRPLDEGEKDMDETLERLLSELVRHDAASEMICQGLLTRTIQLLSTRYQFSLSRQQKKKMNLLLLEEITEYMERHIRDISLQELSEEFHFQIDYFNRLLKRLTGHTYTEYLQELRLKKARELLEDPKLNIDEIVKQVGYRNKGYFYKLFMEQYEVTPAQYRKQCQE